MSKLYDKYNNILTHKEKTLDGWINKYYFYETPISVLINNPNMIKPAPKQVFCFWTGYNKLTPNRLKCLDSIKHNIGIDVKLITNNNLDKYIIKGHSIHPAYKYLSETCKGDYLKAYFMHFYGGGYTDIKHTDSNWNLWFDNLNNSNKWINGYKHGAGCTLGKNNQRTLSISRIGCLFQIGTTLHICKPNTPITSEWFLRLHQILDNKLDLLIKNPSKDTRDELGKKLSDGSISKYPITWGELNADILGDILWKYRDKILQEMSFPNFSDYI